MVLASGGIGPAIQGTVITVGLASLIGAPIGILSGIYLSEYAPAGSVKGGRERAVRIFANTIRLFNDVLTGLPSIVIGIVGYVTIVLAINSFSVWAGAFALSIIMIPIISRVTEETLKLVPNSLREAGYSLGISKSKITLYIVLKNAKDGGTDWCYLSHIKNSWRNRSSYNDYTRHEPVLYRPHGSR